MNIIIRKIKRAWAMVYFFKEDKVVTHLTYPEKQLLYSISKSLPVKSTVVEIGSYLGASTNFMAKRLSKDSYIYCIDTWGNHAMKYSDHDSDGEQRDTHNDFLINTKAYNHKIIPLRGWSYEMIDKVKELVSSIDFLFIDGDHNYEGVKQDWDLYSPLLKPGSIVAFHDTGWAEGVKKVIDEDVMPVSTLLYNLPNLMAFKIK